ncbi:MAG: adenylate kinase [Candidatus Levybacteria bacterium CG10_big_fil_rev_8_21_14_0_10_35_13]|nr:MAG: adenylate kinase [Candidatus Levybacteria bacterium CG10_big_fil_rev_8_21_14_0_10_35_13]
MNIILIGIQGSGKSTQGNLLSEKLGIPYLSAGHIFRILSKQKTPLGHQIKVVMNAGFLIPDEKTLKLVEEYLKKPQYKKGFILDGFPRTLVQAKKFRIMVDKAIYIKISDKEALWRISGREEIREDETLMAIRKRIEMFHKFTEPVLEYYQSKDILLEVDGERSVIDISENILSKID